MTTDPSADRDPAEEERDRPLAPPDEGAVGRGPARVVLVPGESPGERRSRRLRRLLLALGLAAGAAAVFYLSGGDVLDRAVPSAGAVRGGQAERAAAGAEDTGSAGAGESAAPADPGLREYRDRAGELSAAVRRFRERAEAFRLERIGCAGLAREYETVDRVMVDLARVYVRVRQRLGPDGRSLYERAMSLADSAGRLFDQSGCQRLP